MVKQIQINRIKVSDHFYLDELIPKEVYVQYYEKSIQFLDPRIIPLLEGLRKFFNTPVIVNTWWNNGLNNYRGFRPEGCQVGSKYSQHKMGRGIDCQFPANTDYNKVRQMIRDNYEEYFKPLGLSTIEKDTPNHLHIDCRNTSLIKPDGSLYEVPYQ